MRETSPIFPKVAESCKKLLIFLGVSDNCRTFVAKKDDMRYTTLIDVTEMAKVWRSHNATRLYVFMAMACGYHDEDRDALSASLAVMAERCGITISAVRCALRLLKSAGLLSQTEEGTYVVKKYVVPEIPTPRNKTARKTGAGDIGGQLDKQAEEYQRRVLTAVRSSTPQELVTWLRELEEGRSLRHRGAQLNATEANIEWMKKVINQLNK